MKKILWLIVSSFTLLCLISAAYAAEAVSPAGYWKTIDDVTHKPKSILQLYLNANNNLEGRIVKIFPRPGFDQNELCTACKGTRHNQRMVDMVVLEGLQQNGKNPLEWLGGEIMDPNNGKTYHCLIRLSEDGQTLSIRGYIGIPLFGRTQTWSRVQNPV